MMKKILEKIIVDHDNYESKIQKHLLNNQSLIVITVNPEIIMSALEDDQMYKIMMSNKTLLICESVGLEWAIKKVFKKDIIRKPGIELFSDMIDNSIKTQQKIYLYGAKEKVITSFVNKLTENHVNIVGFHDGYSLKPGVELYTKISSTKPDIVAFALGAVKQEKALHELTQYITQGVLIGVGGSFDVLSGMKKRAPRCIRKIKLEWLYRIIREPKRIIKFIKIYIPFIFKVLKSSQ